MKRWIGNSFGSKLWPFLPATATMALLFAACPRQGGSKTSFEVRVSEPAPTSASQEIKRETEQASAEAERQESQGETEVAQKAGGDELARFRQAALSATYLVGENTKVELKEGRWSHRFKEGEVTWEEQAWVLDQPVAAGDLDGDGDQDLVFVLVYSGGGSGSFVYLAGALNDGGEARPLETVLLGDRVRVEKLSIGEDGTLTVRYLHRKPDEPMAAKPTVPEELRFKVEGGKFKQITE